MTPAVQQVHHTVDTIFALSPLIHEQTSFYTKRRGNLFERTFGLCDLMTTLALDKLSDAPALKTAFVGIQIPKRTMHQRLTHTSHTIGLIYGFEHPQEREQVVWFDYACAQYGINQEVLCKVLDREQLYLDLRRTYGGGIWQPGGNWLAHIDLKLIHKLFPDPLDLTTKNL